VIERLLFYLVFSFGFLGVCILVREEYARYLGLDIIKNSWFGLTDSGWNNFYVFLLYYWGYQ